jgi:hypothetical protein
MDGLGRAKQDVRAEGNAGAIAEVHRSHAWARPEAMSPSGSPGRTLADSDLGIYCVNGVYGERARPACNKS